MAGEVGGAGATGPRVSLKLTPHLKVLLSLWMDKSVLCVTLISREREVLQEREERSDQTGYRDLKEAQEHQDLTDQRYHNQNESINRLD